LPAWQPILTAKTVLPLFFIIGVIFVVLGGVLLHYSNLVNELVQDYTDCISTTDNITPCSKFNSTTPCQCQITLKLDRNFDAPVYLYYGLKNFYQNHRRYVKSRDDNQLLGNKVTSVTSECKPYDVDNSSKIYAPCGAIANSLFNDSFVLSYTGPNDNLAPTQLDLIATGIAWSTDKSVKFKNPDNWDNTVKPINWAKNASSLSSDPSNTGYKNEDLIVWMRTAALPTFRKFYRRVRHENTFGIGLPAGTYRLLINYSKFLFNFSIQN
jgi:hypothetical protein